MALGEVLGKHWVYFAILILDVVHYIGILSSAKWVTQAPTNNFGGGLRETYG